MAILSRMDELIIDERKYVSTKRAAKITGYAKDYVGQLCREGRVPARLVGRSWYVLESAIQDHRFGMPEEAPATPVAEESAPVHPTWESPRYEAASVEPLPAVRRDEPSQPVAQAAAAPSELHEAWREWFSMRGAPKATEEPVELFSEGAAVEEGAEESSDIASITEDNLEHEEVEMASVLPVSESEESREPEPEAEMVPIRAIKTEPQYVRPIEEVIPARAAAPEPLQARLERSTVRRRGNSPFLRLGLATGAFAAIILVSLAVIGSGYADKYVAYLGQMRLLAGISVYNK